MNRVLLRGMVKMYPLIFNLYPVDKNKELIFVVFTEKLDCTEISLNQQSF